METVYVAVRLKSPDPGAVTALYTLRRTLPGSAPEQLFRYDLWEFVMKPGQAGAVPGMITRFTDIVNPNKHVSFILPPGGSPPGESGDLSWTGVLVRDHLDSRSRNWTALLARRGFPVEEARWGVLWRFGYSPGTGDVQAMAMRATLSETRDSGLLANPVSQEAVPWR
jgi:hypothetical protein